MPKASSKEPRDTLALYPPYAKDIRNLLVVFLGKNTSQLTEFKEEWKTQKFSLIHTGKPDDVSGKVYVQELFATCLGYLVLNNPLLLQVGVIYLLFCLYYTQPSSPKVKINISIEIFQQLTKLQDEFKRQNIADAFHVLNKLRADGAFCYTATVKIDPLLSSLNPPQKQVEPLDEEVMEADTVQDVLEFTSLSLASNQYCGMKQHYLELLKTLPKPDADLSSTSSSSSIPSVVQNTLTIVKPNFAPELLSITNRYTSSKSNRAKAFREDLLAVNRGAAKAARQQRANSTRGKKISSSIDRIQEQFQNSLGAAAESAVTSAAVATAASSSNASAASASQTEAASNGDSATPASNVVQGQQPAPTSAMPLVKQEPIDEDFYRPVSSIPDDGSNEDDDETDMNSDDEEGSSRKGKKPAKKKGKRTTKKGAGLDFDAILSQFLYGKTAPASETTNATPSAEAPAKKKKAPQRKETTSRKKKSTETPSTPAATPSVDQQLAETPSEASTPAASAATPPDAPAEPQPEKKSRKKATTKEKEKDKEKTPRKPRAKKADKEKEEGATTKKKETKKKTTTTKKKSSKKSSTESVESEPKETSVSDAQNGEASGTTADVTMAESTPAQQEASGSTEQTDRPKRARKPKTIFSPDGDVEVDVQKVAKKRRAEEAEEGGDVFELQSPAKKKRTTKSSEKSSTKKKSASPKSKKKDSTPTDTPATPATPATPQPPAPNPATLLGGQLAGSIHPSSSLVSALQALGGLSVTQGTPTSMNQQLPSNVMMYMRSYGLALQQLAQMQPSAPAPATPNSNTDSTPSGNNAP